MVYMALWSALVLSMAGAYVELPHVFSDHMVLQCNMPIRVWGRADAGEEITVKLGAHEAHLLADAKGRWSVVLPALPAGGPHAMHVIADNALRIDDIYMGEVWVCAGQSNMEWPVRKATNGKEEISKADLPEIRFLKIPRKAAGRPLFDIDAVWQRCSPDSARDFSMLAYCYGCELHSALNVPVGLIDISWSGSPIDSWIAQEGFLSVPDLKYILDRTARIYRAYRVELKSRLNAYEKWIASARAALKRGTRVPAMPGRLHHPLATKDHPTALFNAMIHPVVPFTIRGAIWYQGEQNLGQGTWYHRKMKALIQGWREVWELGDFPFYFVQLAPFCYWGLEAGKSASGDDRPFKLPELWAAQAQCLELPNTGMVVSTDIGNIFEIHPQNKKEVARRLSLWALAKTYGFDDLICSGPLFRSMTVEGSRARVAFDYVGSGLCTRDKAPPNWFEIAGADLSFVKAEAEIDEEIIWLWHDEVKEPVAVRFGWHQGAQPNLINKEGLPASPFVIHLNEDPTCMKPEQQKP